MNLSQILATMPDKPNAEAFAAFQSAPWEDVIPRLIQDELRLSSQRPLPRSSLIAKSYDTVVLAVQKAYTLQLSSLEAAIEQVSTIETLAGPTYLRVLGQGSLTLQSYELPEGFNSSIFQLESRLRKGPLVTIQSGQSREFHPWQGAWVPLDRQGNPAVLRVVWKPTTDLIWHFSKQSLKASYCSASRSVDSRAQLILQLLAETGEDRLTSDLLDLIIRLSRHPTYFVRWAAVACLSRLRPHLGLTLARERLTDDHPELRFAAAELLKQEVPYGKSI